METESGVATSNVKLGAAMVSRAVIEQAKGMLMNAAGCGPDEALAQLAQESAHLKVKLRDLATQLVDEASNRPAAFERKV